MRLLVTRPLADAKRTADALRDRGHDAIVAPLLQIVALPGATLGVGPWSAILVTSANAAAAIAAHHRGSELLHLPVFAVGRRSADAMRKIGFANVASADGGVNDLARLAAARMKPGASLLYLAGEDRSGDLAGPLRTKGYAVEIAEVYRADAAASLPDVAVSALATGLHGVLHFSRRSAETYLAAARTARLLERALKPVHYCLSAQVAEPLAAAGAPAIRIAAAPRESELFALLDAE